MLNFKKFWGDKHIFMDSAFERMREHKVSSTLAKKVLRDFNRSETSKVPGAKLYSMRVSDKEEVGVLAKKNVEGTDKILIISVWRRKLYN